MPLQLLPSAEAACRLGSPGVRDEVVESRGQCERGQGQAREIRGLAREPLRERSARNTTAQGDSGQTMCGDLLGGDCPLPTRASVTGDMLKFGFPQKQIWRRGFEHR